jgi:hypothetical protein
LTISCLLVFPKTLLPFPSCDCCPVLHPSTLFVVLFFLRHSSSLPPRSFICLLPHSCCLRSRSLMPFLHSGPFKHLFSPICSFRVLGAMSSFPCFCSLCSLARATFAQWVILILAVANSLCGPQFSWVPIFLKRFLFHHATLAQLSPSCKRQPTSSRIHNLLGSFPLSLRVALQLATRPYAGSSVPWPVSLWHLP